MISIIYMTAPKNSAKKIAETLLEKKLAGCIVFWNAKSIYWWKNKIQNDSEAIMLCKTTKKNSKKVIEEIRRIHPYKVPCIIELSGKAGIEYEKWLKDASKN